MFVWTKVITSAAFVFLLAFYLCDASFHTTVTKFTKGKQVATNYMTLQSYSDINCVRKCFEEKKDNRCSFAGYNVATNNCYLSNDIPQFLIDTADEDYGVFFYVDGMLQINVVIHHINYATPYEKVCNHTEVTKAI